MKKIFKSFLEILESVSKARAATSLARQGKIEEARRLMLVD